jgi:phage-related tail fiber protein
VKVILKVLCLLVVALFAHSTFVVAAPVIVIPGESSGYTALDSSGDTTASSATDFTVGAIDVFLASPLPTGWLECDGSTVQAADYPSLVVYLTGNPSATSATLPDLRGEFVRGWDHGRGVDAGRSLLSTQSGQNLTHGHTATASPAGAHTHTGTTDPGGSHTHTIPVVNPPGSSGSYFGSGGG